MGGLTPPSPGPGRTRPARPRWRAPVLVGAIILLVAVAALAVAVIVRRPGPSAADAGGSAASGPRPVPVFAASSLAPAHGVLFGAWVQPPDWSVPDAQQKAIAVFEHTIGRRIAIDQLYVNWGQSLQLDVARWDLRHGSIPMISWSGTRSTQITDGADDAMLRATARQLKALHGPVMLRWFAEMDLGQHRRQTISPASFVAAWRHMHRIFTRAGAANVLWVWCPSGSTFSDGRAQAYYPGNSYVDWIGADGYNWAPEVPDTPWRSFGQIFATFYAWGSAKDKPLLIGEYGSVEGRPGAKAAWFRQAEQQLKTQFPAIRALVYFNSEHPDFGKSFDWRITTSTSSLAAFRAFAHDPYFRARPPIKAKPHH